MKNLIDAYIPTIRRHPTQRVKIPCGTKKPERIKLHKPAKIDRFDFYDLPKMKKFRDTRFDDPKPLSFEELKEEAKKMGACGTIIYDKVIIYNGWLYLYEDGTLKTEGDGCVVEQEIDVSYDQMLAIMKALQ